LGEKLVKMLVFCQNWIFGPKFNFSNSVLKPLFCSLMSWFLPQSIRVVKSHALIISRCFSRLKLLGRYTRTHTGRNRGAKLTQLLSKEKGMMMPCFAMMGERRKKSVCCFCLVVVLRQVVPSVILNEKQGKYGRKGLSTQSSLKVDSRPLRTVVWKLKMHSGFMGRTQCSKSSFFVQKFNFDLPRKLSFFWAENSWKCCGFRLFSCWKLWFHEKNCQKKFG